MFNFSSMWEVNTFSCVVGAGVSDATCLRNSCGYSQLEYLDNLLVRVVWVCVWNVRNDNNLISDILRESDRLKKRRFFFRLTGSAEKHLWLINLLLLNVETTLLNILSLSLPTLSLKFKWTCFWFEVSFSLKNFVSSVFSRNSVRAWEWQRKTLDFRMDACVYHLILFLINTKFTQK